MKKTTQNKLKTSTALFWKAGIIVAVAVALVLVWEFPRYSDKLRFSSTSKKQSLVASQLIKYLSQNVDSSEKKNICFNTEQGPYDNGNLWCQTATLIHLKKDIDFTQTGKQFIQIAEAEGWTTHSGTSYGESSFLFAIDHTMDCSLSFMDEAGNKYGSATYDVLFGAKAPVLAIACADRAKAKHYQYID